MPPAESRQIHAAPNSAKNYRRAQGRSAKGMTGIRTARPSKAKRPNNPDMIGLRQAFEYIVAAYPNPSDRPEELRSYETLRKKVVWKGIFNAVQLGKRYFVSKSAIDRVAAIHHGKQVDVDVDQALVNFYDTNPNAIAAVREGICKNLTHALYVLERWQEDPANSLKQAEKVREAEAVKAQTLKACEACARPDDVAREQHAQVISAVTNGATSISISQETALTPWFHHRCRGCWRWALSAPVEEMRAALEKK